MSDVAFATTFAQGRAVTVRKHMLEDKHLVRGGMVVDEVVDALCVMTLDHFSDQLAKAGIKVLLMPIEISNSVEIKSRDTPLVPTNAVVFCRASLPCAWKHVASKGTP